MPVNTKKELEAAGYQEGLQAFREALADVFAELFPSWTDDELRNYPTTCLRFVKAVRAKLRLPNCPEDLIMRTIINMRKSRHLSK